MVIMDVNETLARLRAAVSQTRLASNSEEAAWLGEQLAESFEALDAWLSKGGFLPTDWAAPRIEHALKGR